MRMFTILTDKETNEVLLAMDDERGMVNDKCRLFQIEDMESDEPLFYMQDGKVCLSQKTMDIIEEKKANETEN